MLRRATKEPLKVFEPEDRHEAVQGWALHTTRRRKIHEAEARHLDRLRHWTGSIAASLAAVAGTSAFAAWQSDTENTYAAVGTAVIGIGAAVLGSMLTFLDLGARAEAHRRAAADYKNVLREFEAGSGSRQDGNPNHDAELLEKLKTLLTEADRTAPTVPEKRGYAIEHQPFCFVPTADELTPNAGASRAATPPEER